MSKNKSATFGVKRSRFFSLTTYCSESQIKRMMHDHINSMRAICYILHDKDEAEPHYHILMRTYSAWTPAQIIKWFSDFRDKEKNPINTFCEIANDMESLKCYILHDTAEAREAGKYQYSMSDIHDFGFQDLAERKDSYDNSYEILLHVLADTNPRQLVRMYGRDFLYHLNAYYECADKISYHEGFKEAKMRSIVSLNERSMKIVKDVNEV